MSLDDAISSDSYGKAHGLAKLRSSGWPVPDGYYIAPDRFDHTTELTPGQKAEVLDAYGRLGDGAVAVRSSGSLEDAPGVSQRGQFRSFLNVVGDEALLEAIEAVRADGLKVGERLGVVVQQMIVPESAGVMFTVSPVSAAEILIESAWGLGLNVVEGRPADVFAVDRETREVKVNTVTKPDAAVAAATGTARVPNPSDIRDAPSLSVEDARRLAVIGLDLQREWGGPLDLEWALAGGKFWILQARRIAEPDSWDRPSAPRAHDRWSRWGMADLFPDPLSPFTWSLASEHWSAIRRASFRRSDPSIVAGITFFRLYDCRLYFNVGAAASLLSGAGRSTTPSREYGSWGSVWTAAGARGIAARRGRLKLPSDLMDRMRGAWSMRGALKELEAAPATARKYDSKDIGGLERGALWRMFLELWTEIARLEILEGIVDDEVFGSMRHLEAVCNRWLGRPELVSALMLARDGRLDDIAGSLLLLAREGNSTDEEAIQKRLSAFLARHGHRARGELDWAQPRWAERPLPVMEILRHGIGKGRDDKPHADPEAAERAVRGQLRRLPGEVWLPWRRLAFSLFLGRARRLQPLRSMPRDRVMHLFFAGRRILLELSDRLVHERALETRDDLFCLTVQEVTDVLDGNLEPGYSRALAAKRRLQLSRAALRPSPEILGENGEVLEERLPKGESGPRGELCLTGRAASPGVAEGPARVIAKPADATSIRIGDVLVLPAGDLGSTLYFPMAAAIVVERGSLLSHAVVLAREYGLPTVVGVLSADALNDGSWLRVDGSKGTVTIVPTITGDAARKD